MDHIEAPRLFDVANNNIILDPNEQHHVNECPECAKWVSAFARETTEIVNTSPDPASMQKGLNILIVDDDYRCIKVLIEWLSMHGHQSFGLTGGKDLEGWVQNHHFDVVLVNILIPDANGLMLIWNLAQKTNVRVIAIGSKVDESIVSLARVRGAAHFLSKPINLRELEQHLNKAAEHVSAMPLEFFNPSWEHTDIVLIDDPTIQKAQRELAGCESCSDEAEIPFDTVIDRITGRDPSRTDYLLAKPAQCLFCGKEIHEKTLVDLEGQL